MHITLGVNDWLKFTSRCKCSDVRSTYTVFSGMFGNLTPMPPPSELISERVKTIFFLFFFQKKMAKEDVQKCLEWLLNTQVSLLPVFLLSHSRTLSSRIVYICKNYEINYLAKIPLIFSKLCRKWQGRDGFMCKVCFLFYPPQLCLFSIFSLTKPLYLPVHVLFLLGIWNV